MGTDLARRTAELCFDRFAEDISIAGQPARGIVSTELVELGTYESVMERRLTVSVLVDEVPEIDRNQEIVVRGQTHRVDQLLAVRDDPDVVAKVVLR